MLQIVYILAILLSTCSAVFASDKLVVLSPPKCGTHLIGKVVGEITGKNPVYLLDRLGKTEKAVEKVEAYTASDQIVVSHHFTRPVLDQLIARGYKVVFLLRDPRDQLISVRNWLREGQWPWLKVSKISNSDKQTEELITGSRYGWRCVSHLLSYETRVDGISPDRLYRTSYEKLVGPLGGGDFAKQTEELLRISQFVSVDLSIEELESIGQRVYGTPGTFRRGQIGAWRTEFSQRHKKLFKKAYNRDLIRLGYAIDANW